MTTREEMAGWRYLFGSPHGWVSRTAQIGACIAFAFFTSRRGHYDLVENTAVGAVVVAGVVTSLRVPRELQLAALLVGKGMVVGLLFDASVRATGPTHDEVGAGWLVGAVLGAALVVFAGSGLEQREAGRGATPVPPVVDDPSPGPVTRSPARSPWPAVTTAAFLGAVVGRAARRRQR